MSQYRLKDIDADAFQLVPETRNKDKWPEWIKEMWTVDAGHPGSMWTRHFPKKILNDELIVQTHTAGSIRLRFGDWIVRSSEGKISVFDDETFKEKYEAL